MPSFTDKQKLLESNEDLEGLESKNPHAAKSLTTPGRPVRSRNIRMRESHTSSNPIEHPPSHVEQESGQYETFVEEREPASDGFVILPSGSRIDLANRGSDFDSDFGSESEPDRRPTKKTLSPKRRERTSA